MLVLFETISVFEREKLSTSLHVAFHVYSKARYLFSFLGLYPLRFDNSSFVPVQRMLVCLLLREGVSKESLAHSHAGLWGAKINFQFKLIVNTIILLTKVLRNKIEVISKLGQMCSFGLAEIKLGEL